MWHAFPGNSDSDEALQDVLVRAFYRPGHFEDPNLFPIGLPEQWWAAVDSPSELLSCYAALEPPPQDRPVYVELRGNRSRRDAYRHMKTSGRKFMVLEIIVMRPLDAKEEPLYETTVSELRRGR